MSVYIAAHKEFHKPEEPGYRVILAGALRNAERAETVFWDCRDDEGEDNISGKNPSFCELTALYWLWKHCSDDVIGLVHYRRYFSNRWSSRKILSETTAEKILEKYDIILPQIAFQRMSMREEFVRQCGTCQDLDLLRKIVAELAPAYTESFDRYFSGRRTCFMNMMICRRNLFREYCAWLFPILFEMEKRTDLSGRSDYQRRLYGFLGERLLNVWVLGKGLRACHIFLLETDKKHSAPLELVYRLARTGTYAVQMAGKR